LAPITGKGNCTESCHDPAQQSLKAPRKPTKREIARDKRNKGRRKREGRKKQSPPDGRTGTKQKANRGRNPGKFLYRGGTKKRVTKLLSNQKQEKKKRRGS